MSTETLLFGVLPAAVAIGLAIASIAMANRARSVFQLLTSIVVTIGAAWSLLILYRMMRGAWPSFVPHIVIGVLVIIVMLQGTACEIFAERKTVDPDQRRRE